MSTSMAEALREYDKNVVLKLCWEQSLNEASPYKKKKQFPAEWNAHFSPAAYSLVPWSLGIEEVVPTPLSVNLLRF